MGLQGPKDVNPKLYVSFPACVAVSIFFTAMVTTMTMIVTILMTIITSIILTIINDFYSHSYSYASFYFVSIIVALSPKPSLWMIAISVRVASISVGCRVYYRLEMRGLNSKLTI